MRIPFTGLELRRTAATKAVPPSTAGLYSPAQGRGGWWPMVRESFAGAWQRNITVQVQDVMTYSTVWACVTLIASDVSKLWVKLVQEFVEGDIRLWTETTSPAYSPVLWKPNHFSTRIKFFEYWMLSKLLHGNTYVLKERDSRQVVTAMYILDPTQVKVLVAPDGAVYYSCGRDPLSNLTDTNYVFPASEIIHDIGVPLYHPLVGVSPIHACAVNALQGLKVQEMSTALFANGSQPGGILTAPHAISNEVADRIRVHWETNYAGQQNIGRVVVLGDGLEYKPMTMTAVDAQLIDQLKWNDERICAAFHVPGYMVGIGPAPPYTDIQSIMLQYYNQALQAPIEQLEYLLGEGLALPNKYAVEFDLDSLLRMDTKTQVENSTKGISGGLFTSNEERAKFGRKPVAGGDVVYMQEQQHSLEALAKRDENWPPPEPVPVAAAPDEPDDDAAVDEDEDEEDVAAALNELWFKALDATPLWVTALEHDAP